MIAAMDNTQRAATDDVAARPGSVAEAERSATDAAIAAVEEQFALLFNQVSTQMRDRAAAVHPDLQPLGYKLLTTMVRTGPIHAGGLAELLGTDKSVISRQTRVLEDLGFIERRTDPTDRRASFLEATPAAIERVNEVRAADQAKLYRSLRQWDDHDLHRLAELLERLNDLQP